MGNNFVNNYKYGLASIVLDIVGDFCKNSFDSYEVKIEEHEGKFNVIIHLSFIKDGKLYKTSRLISTYIPPNKKSAEESIAYHSNALIVPLINTLIKEMVSCSKCWTNTEKKLDDNLNKEPINLLKVKREKSKDRLIEQLKKKGLL